MDGRRDRGKHAQPLEPLSASDGREEVDEPADCSTSAPDLPGRGTRTGLHVRCPHCRESMELDDEQPLGEIVCAACENKFSLAVDATLDWQSQEAPGTSSPKAIGHFRLVERLGAGSFGTVWKARDTQLDRDVAARMIRVAYAVGLNVSVDSWRFWPAPAKILPAAFGFAVFLPGPPWPLKRGCPLSRRPIFR